MFIRSILGFFSFCALAIVQRWTQSISCRIFRALNTCCPLHKHHHIPYRVAIVTYDVKTCKLYTNLVAVFMEDSYILITVAKDNTAGILVEYQFSKNEKSTNRTTEMNAVHICSATAGTTFNQFKEHVS